MVSARSCRKQARCIPYVIDHTVTAPSYRFKVSGSRFKFTSYAVATTVTRLVKTCSSGGTVESTLFITPQLSYSNITYRMTTCLFSSFKVASPVEPTARQFTTHKVPPLGTCITHVAQGAGRPPVAPLAQVLNIVPQLCPPMPPMVSHAQSIPGQGSGQHVSTTAPVPGQTSQHRAARRSSCTCATVAA